MSECVALTEVAASFRLLLWNVDSRRLEPQVGHLVETGLNARIVRGRKMRTSHALFDEVAAAFQFPSYFGENWDAFDECIADLEYVPAGTGHVMVITDPEQVLADDEELALGWFAGSLHRAYEEWSQAIERGERWDRAAVPFHVVLAGGRDTLAAATPRWAAAGATLLDMPGE